MTDNVVIEETTPIVVNSESNNTVGTVSTETLVVSSSTTDNVVISDGVQGLVLNSEYNVVVEVESSTVVVTGSTGPAGAPGVNEDDMPYAKKIDFVTDSLFYRGEAAVGSSTSSATWRIKKVVLDADGDVTETWAGGNANFDKIWDDRLSLIYS